MPEAVRPLPPPEDHGPDELLALINAIVRLGGDGALVDGLWDRYCRLSEHLGFVSADELAAEATPQRRSA